jgi:hypothetical protein
MDYDDETETTRYVWDYCQSLMTDLERRVFKAIIARQKSDASSPEMARTLLQSWGGGNDAEIEAALADGAEAFRQRVCRRLLQAQVMKVHRCPRCDRVLRTPTARQCFWCGHDWHEAIDV